MEVELTSANYGEKFRALLHVEELQMEVDIQHYDMENAKLRPSVDSKCLILKVLCIRHLNAKEDVYYDSRCLDWQRIDRPFSKAIACMYPLPVARSNTRDLFMKLIKKRCCFALHLGNGTF